MLSFSVGHFVLFSLVLLLLFFLSCPGGLAAGSNAFRVVVVRDREAEALRTAPDGVLFRIPPYFVQLSSNWTVVERGAWDGDSLYEKEEEKGRLLHCRLPLPQTTETLALLEERYVMYYSKRVHKAIWEWLMGAAKGDGCVFGDGEGLVTGFSEWYLYCPQGEIRKVNKTAVLARYNIAASELPKKVERLMQHSWGDVMKRSRKLDKWTFVIGEYNKHVTQPHWNTERRAWELLYPTARECDAGQLNMPPRGTPKKEDIYTQLNRKEMWETVVRFHCEGEQKAKRVHQWSVTEVRQACLYEIAFLSPAVCEWERGLENLWVNPIPCIAI